MGATDDNKGQPNLDLQCFEIIQSRKCKTPQKKRLENQTPLLATFSNNLT